MSRGNSAMAEAQGSGVNGQTSVLAPANAALPIFELAGNGANRDSAQHFHNNALAGRILAPQLLASSHAAKI